MPKLLPLLLLSVLLPFHVSALQTEPDDTLERGAFEWLNTGKEPVVTEDAADDVTAFDRFQAGTVPSLLPDLRRVEMTRGDDGWRVRFETQAPLPADPGMPVNFHVYVDRPEVQNAPTGVFRAGSDLAVLLLFGAATKWHTEWWTYDAQSDQWFEQPPVPFTTEPTAFTLTIPYGVLPREASVPVRFLSLTNENRVTAIDIAPGRNLPPALPRASSRAAVSASSQAGGGWTGYIIGGATLLALAFGFIGWRKMK